MQIFLENRTAIDDIPLSIILSFTRGVRLRRDAIDRGNRLGEPLQELRLSPSFFSCSREKGAPSFGWSLCLLLLFLKSGLLLFPGSAGLFKKCRYGSGLNKPSFCIQTRVCERGHDAGQILILSGAFEACPRPSACNPSGKQH